MPKWAGKKYNFLSVSMPHFFHYKCNSKKIDYVWEVKWLKQQKYHGTENRTTPGLSFLPHIFGILNIGI